MPKRSAMQNRTALRVAADPEAAPSLVRPSVRVRTAAERLDMDESQVRKLIKDGALEGHLIGKRGVRIYVDSIKAYQDGRPTLGAPASESPPPGPKKRRETAAHKEAIAFLDKLGLVSRH